HFHIPKKDFEKRDDNAEFPVMYALVKVSGGSEKEANINLRENIQDLPRFWIRRPSDIGRYPELTRFFRSERVGTSSLSTQTLGTRRDSSSTDDEKIMARKDRTLPMTLRRRISKNSAKKRSIKEEPFEKTVSKREKRQIIKLECDVSSSEDDQNDDFFDDKPTESSDLSTVEAPAAPFKDFIIKMEPQDFLPDSVPSESVLLPPQLSIPPCDLNEERAAIDQTTDCVSPSLPIKKEVLSQGHPDGMGTGEEQARAPSEVPLLSQSEMKWSQSEIKLSQPFLDDPKESPILPPVLRIRSEIVHRLGRDFPVVTRTSSAAPSLHSLKRKKQWTDDDPHHFKSEPVSPEISHGVGPKRGEEKGGMMEGGEDSDGMQGDGRGDQRMLVLRNGRSLQKETSGKAQCRLCHNWYNVKNLKTHVNMHSKDIRPFSCSLCK
ncbi:hypothetical protein PMAYCL1PPCAC_18964, partial [Pristionchus mayeri]